MTALCHRRHHRHLHHHPHLLTITSSISPTTPASAFTPTPTTTHPTPPTPAAATLPSHSSTAADRRGPDPPRLSTASPVGPRCPCPSSSTAATTSALHAPSPTSAPQLAYSCPLHYRHSHQLQLHFRLQHRRDSPAGVVQEGLRMHNEQLVREKGKAERVQELWEREQAALFRTFSTSIASRLLHHPRHLQPSPLYPVPSAGRAVRRPNRTPASSPGCCRADPAHQHPTQRPLPASGSNRRARRLEAPILCPHCTILRYLPARGAKGRCLGQGGGYRGHHPPPA